MIPAVNGFFDLTITRRVIFSLFTLFIWTSYCHLIYPECIRYEFHEVSPKMGQADALSKNCFAKKGFLEKFSSQPIKKSYPVIYNITFECCMNRTCKSDLECPFNFYCSQSERTCMVSKCSLTDDLDLVLNEGIECIIDEDCEFFAPHDAPFWRCINPCFNKTCPVCKRCPAGIDITSSSFTTTEYPPITDPPTSPAPPVNVTLSPNTNTTTVPNANSTVSINTTSTNSRALPPNITEAPTSVTPRNISTTPGILFEMFTTSAPDNFDNSSDMMPVIVRDEDPFEIPAASTPPAPISLDNSGEDPLDASSA